MVEISDAEMDARLAQVRPYCMAMLKVGPNYEPRETRSAAQSIIVREHGRRNMQMRAEGKMAMVGPVWEAMPIVGICIFNVDAAEARRIMQTDPAVEAGIFIFDLATWFGVPGDGLPAA